MALEARPARGHFPFNERKATAAAAFLLQQEGGTMDYMRLVKLLYLAERESLAHLGHPLTGDKTSASTCRSSYLGSTRRLASVRSSAATKLVSLPRRSWKKTFDAAPSALRTR